MIPADFVRSMTAIGSPPLVPEIRLHLATEVTPLWQATEDTLLQANLPPPFWAFAWLGGQVLARYLLDHPGTVVGRHVLDFASGSGIAAIAACKAGAAGVSAVEIDPFAAAAIRLNAGLNLSHIEVVEADIVGTACGAEVILAGDVCYERPMAERVIAWLRDRASAGTLVLLGDPGRAYLPSSSIEPLARYPVPASLELENLAVRETTVYRVSA